MVKNNPIQISPEGHAALQAELKELMEIKRPAIVERVASTRAEGDLRENGAYHDARQELGMLDGRVQTIEATLRQAVIVEASPVDGTVHLGSTVVVRDEFGESTYVMVGPAEADLAAGRISAESPLGQALMGRQHGSAITFETPGGPRDATIVEVR